MRKRSPLRNAAEYGAARLVIATLAWTPRPVADGLARFYAHLLDRFVPRLRRIALRNLAMAMPELTPQRRSEITDGVFDSIARLLVAFARFPQIHRGNISDWIRYDGLEHFQEALRGGKGVLFATAHLGNWELSALAHALLTGPMNIVVRPLDNPLLDRFVSRYRGLSGNCVIDKKDFVRGILKALHSNEAVGILIDQNAGLDDGVFVDFFGQKAATNPSFAKLASRTGASVIPGYAVWCCEEKRYILRFDRPMSLSGNPVSDTQLLQSQLESVIRRYPDQWLWIHRRWKTRPRGEGPLY